MSIYREALQHIRTLPNAFWVVICATLMNQIGNMAFVFLMLYLNKHLHFTLTQSSIAIVAFGSSMLMTGLFGGSLVDTIGAARVMAANLFLNGLVLLLFPWVHHFPGIIGMCLLWGLSFGLYRPASQTFVSYLSHAGMHKVTFSVYRLAINLGMSVGPAIGGYLATHSFVAIFIANGVANLLASFILLAGLSRSAWFNHRPAYKPTYELSIKWLKHDKTLRIFAMALIPITIIFYQHSSTLAIFLNHDLNLPLTLYGLLFTLNTLMIVFFELPLNVVTLKWPYRLVFILGALFITLGFAGYYFAAQIWEVLLLTVLWTIGEMIIFPAATSYIADIASEERRGSYMSMYSACSSIGLLCGPSVGGIVMEYAGAQGLWLSCGVLGLIAIIIFMYLREPAPRAENH